MEPRLWFFVDFMLYQVVTLLLGAVIYVVVLSLQYSDNKDFATGLLGKDAVFAVDALGVDALGKGTLLGRCPK